MRGSTGATSGISGGTCIRPSLNTGAAVVRLGMQPLMAPPMSDAETRRPELARSVWAWIYAPDGRMGRVDFLYAMLVRTLVVSVLASILAATTVTFAVTGDTWTGAQLLAGMRSGMALLLLAFILTAAGPAVRRLHDLGLPGIHAPWLALTAVLGMALGDRLDYATFTAIDGKFVWTHPATAVDAVLALITTIPSLLIAALLFWPGTKGPNRYGPPPA